MARREALMDGTLLLTTAEVARRFRVDRNTVYRWRRIGILPFIRTPGGAFRYREPDVDALLAKKGAP